MEKRAPSPTAQCEALNTDHRCLGAIFDELELQVQADDPSEVRRAWEQFERALLAHIAWEESFMLPAYGRSNPVEALAILDEHRRFRTLLAEMGVGIDVQRVRRETVDEFVALLCAHAAREEHSLYRWANAAAHESGPARESAERARQAFVQASAGVARS